MKIHEYQGKKLLDHFKIKIPKSRVLFSLEQGIQIIKDFTDPPWVLKAQIHAGGRADGGGIKFVNDIKEFDLALNELFGMQLVTKQTGEIGKTVRTVLLEEKCKVLKEFYVSILIERNSQNICFMVSDNGGTDIEELKEKNQDNIRKILVDPYVGFKKNLFEPIFTFFSIEAKVKEKLLNVFNSLYDAFFKLDASLIEINPLALTENEDLLALDSKWNFDSNGLKRQSEILMMRDKDEEDALEIESEKYNLSYIKLAGSIGCMVNGAGLAMATMDIIKLKGGDPANFLDVGGGASVEKVSKAYEILISHPGVKVVLVNIFGGIMRCDYVALGIIKALESNSKFLPIIARIKGFKQEEAQSLLKQSKFPIKLVEDLDEAASLSIKLSKV